MTKGDEELTAEPTSTCEGSPVPPAAPSADAGRRKQYRAPSVQKRRSLVHATLVSGGGTAGALAGGAP